MLGVGEHASDEPDHGVDEAAGVAVPVGDVQNVRAWCQARGVALRILSGPLSNFHDLAADDTTRVCVNLAE
ncbi:hypothetical protein GCM10009560_69280 [Nonomuraea longicatena]|uniref:Uncharacterized protein n=1 Tax=Nonomuraea longicatena TaxID=83682 RepID=A0ABP4BJL1_9ACTN